MFNFKVRVCVNGWLINGSFNVKANDYVEALKKAMATINDASLPGSLNLGLTSEDIYIVHSDAGKIFENKLKKALEKYSSSNLDIVFDEKTCEYCVMCHPDKNSCEAFKVFGIDCDNFIFEDDADVEEWLISLANKHNISYCFEF